MTVLQLLLKIIAGLGNIQGILNALQSAVTQTFAQFTAFFNTLIGEVEYVAALFGFGGGTNQLDTVLAAIAALQASVDALAAAVAALPQVGDAVVLPSPPPTGYGSDPASVWSEELFTSVPAGRAGDLLVSAGKLADFLTVVYGQFPMYYPGGWAVGGAWNEADQGDPNVNFPPQFDPTTIECSDLTMGDWIERVYPGTGVTYNLSGQLQIDNGSDSWTYTYFMRDFDFQQYKAAACGAAGVAQPEPPVWPGLDLVTLGAPVAIAEGVTITEPMDGVLIAISSAPAKQGYFTFDDVLSYRNIGALSFFTDDGEQEFPQSLGFTSCVYCPQTMTRAAGVKLRATVDLVGTVTPWTITPV